MQRPRPLEASIAGLPCARRRRFALAALAAALAALVLPAAAAAGPQRHALGARACRSHAAHRSARHAATGGARRRATPLRGRRCSGRQRTSSFHAGALVSRRKKPISGETSEALPPLAPTGLTALAGDRQVALSWNPSSGSLAVTAYIVYRDGVQVAQPSGTSFTDTGLSDGVSYSYYVLAVDSAGNVSAPSNTVSATPAAASTGSGGEAQTSWVAPGTPPLSDAQAAALVTHRPEQRPANAAANDYEPTASQIEAFRAARNQYGETAAHWNPLYAYVDGRDGLSSPSTDELIQWGAHKWGIPEDWLRAEYVEESWWRQGTLGDRASVSTSWFSQYPLQAQIPGTSEVYESLGITQVKWKPDNSVGIGTEPLRWESTAFNIDFQAATIRYYYDGLCGWCTSGYGPGQQWASIGAWYSPYPWNNSGAQSYVKAVQGYLSTKPWTSPTF